MLRSQNAATLLLRQLRRQPPPHVRLGDTTWGEPVIVPLTELVKACGLITGGMGAGKTMAALLPIRAIIQRLPSLSAVSCGAIDPKGELFDRMLYLLAARIQELHGREQQRKVSTSGLKDGGHKQEEESTRETQEFNRRLETATANSEINNKNRADSTAGPVVKN